MTVVGVTQARSELPELIKRARDEAVFLQRRGKVECVLISLEQYDRLLRASEEAADVAAFDAAMAEEGANIPWEQAKADLGWT
jgi:prevent-host-death family protein